MRKVDVVRMDERQTEERQAEITVDFPEQSPQFFERDLHLEQTEPNTITTHLGMQITGSPSGRLWAHISEFSEEGISCLVDAENDEQVNKCLNKAHEV